MKSFEVQQASVQGDISPNEAYVRLCKLMGGEPLLGAPRREKVVEFLEDIMGFSALDVEVEVETQPVVDERMTDDEFYGTLRQLVSPRDSEAIQ